MGSGTIFIRTNERNISICPYGVVNSAAAFEASGRGLIPLTGTAQYMVFSLAKGVLLVTF